MDNTKSSSVDAAPADRAGEAYWTTLWQATEALPAAIDATRLQPRHYVDWRFHQLFQQIFTRAGLHAGQQLIEIGCARSVWLPYFAKTYGFQVAGLDYSELGCVQAQQILQTAGVTGQILCADLFAPPSAWLANFDVVISFGLVEHFEDTSKVVRAMNALLKPGGLMITVIPNLSGLLGALQKRLDRSIYDIHIPLDQARLRQAHEAVGLRVIECAYFLPANFSVLNTERWRQQPFYGWIKRLKAWSSKTIWLLDRGVAIPPNPWSSPYVVCTAQKVER